MKPLDTARGIDKIVYRQFKEFPFWIGTLDFLNTADIKTVVDIGASSGLATLMFLELPSVEKIYCFEPDEENYGLLVKNTSAYKHIVENHNVGIYYGITESNVVGTGDKSPLGYMVEDATKEHDWTHGTIRYKGKKFNLTTLESVVKIPVDLIKVDVEGSEYNIIENSDLLKQANYLVISFHNHLKKYVKEFITKNLSEYHTVLFESSGVYSDVLLERITNENFICGEETQNR